jgi:hypothetical protein
MSDTVTVPSTPAVDAVVKTAQNMPQLVAGLETVAPSLADSLKGATASVHAAPWGGAAVALVAWAVSYFGLGWSTDFDAAVVGLAYMAGSYVIPYIIKKV